MLKKLVNRILRIKDTETCFECEMNFRYLIYRSIILIVVIGILVPFATQFLLPLICVLLGKDVIEIDSINQWNQFVGIILGLIATLMSVVSMYLGFKNSDDSSASERRTRELIDKLDKETKQILEYQKQMLETQKKLGDEQRKLTDSINNQVVKVKESGVWKTQPDTTNLDE